MRIDKVDSERGHVETNYFSILNPFTGEFKEFGTPRNSHHFTCGFGYDSSIYDYKLVAISDNDGCSNIDVYTVKSDSLNSIKGTVNYSFGITGKRSHGVFFNGALHWLGSKSTQKTSSEVVVCFDTSSETMLNMSLPENIMPPKGFCGHVYKNLGVWGDCICVAFAYDLVRLDVWVMQRYRVKDSWFKKYTTTRLPWSSHEIPFWKPLLCFDSGVILLDTGGKELLLFDPTTERVRSVVVRDITAMYSNRESYFETIASLGSTTYLERQITDETVKNPKRQRFSYNTALVNNESKMNRNELLGYLSSKTFEAFYVI
ncbi:F-box protein CPR1-like [Papaver somniferum]|uniref:F-box protein CPR1-like n=1 Tax=Papaver somniferum TaxID=3469 RepID=UPI000E7028A7|nr:F-box protein CPR1-like [Papaver somniferum]